MIEKDRLKIRHLETKSDKFNMIRNGDVPGNHVNSLESISLYTEWFLESRELFSKYFDDSDMNYKEFTKFDTIGNGHVLSSYFYTTYPLFKILSRKIDKGDIPKTSKKNKSTMNNKAFIVHGHNSQVKLEVARFLEKDMNKEAIILHEQATKGKEVMGKFEENSEVDFAVALWTKDDLGKSNTEPDLKARARQNVIFETGYFIGKLGRHKVFVLLEKGLEAPSDYAGIVYISLEADWKYELRKEIEALYKS